MRNGNMAKRKKHKEKGIRSVFTITTSCAEINTSGALYQ